MRSVEINLNVIQSMAEPHWADNWNFRAYLQQKVDPDEIDATALSLYRDISRAIDCTACGQCCRQIQPVLMEDDQRRLSRAVSPEVMGLLRPAEGAYGDGSDTGMVFRDKPCPLLNGTICSVYQERPDDCRGYPHLDKPDFLGGMIGFIENYGTCPIVFNVISALKSCFAYIPAKDYIGDSDPEQTHGSSFVSSPR